MLHVFIGGVQSGAKKMRLKIWTPLEYIKKKEKRKCKISSAIGNILQYDHIFIHKFAWPNVGEFCVWLTKMWYYYFLIYKHQ